MIRRESVTVPSKSARSRAIITTLTHNHYLNFILNFIILKKKGWREGVEATSRSGASGRATLLPPTPNGRELKRNGKHIRMRPVDKCPAACEQPNTIDMRSAPVDKRPAVNSQLQQATPAPDLSPQPAFSGQTTPAEYPTHSGRAVRPPARFEE